MKSKINQLSMLTLFVVILLFSCKGEATKQATKPETAITKTEDPATPKTNSATTEAIPGKTGDVKKSETLKATEVQNHPSVNIKPNEKITSPVTVKVNSGGIWFGHEAELGTVTLLDAQNKKVATGILSTKENWMTRKPIEYSCELSFKAANGPGKLLIKNNNPSGKVEFDKSFEIPVNITP